MLKRIREMRTKKEKEATLRACMEIGKKYRGKVNHITHENNRYIMVEAKEFTLLVTICKTNKNYCVKLEELLVESKYRNKGIGTDVINIMKRVCKENNCILGLWCRTEENRLFDFYIRLGFEHTETINDKWMEYK